MIPNTNNQINKKKFKYYFKVYKTMSQPSLSFLHFQQLWPPQQLTIPPFSQTNHSN